MQKLLLIFFCSIWLVGCMPALVVAGATGVAVGGGAIIYDKRPLTTMQQDQDGRAVAQYRINHDNILKNHSQISVSVFNHIALLVGQTPSEDLKMRAEHIVMKVSHIQRIYNEIQVTSRPLSQWQHTQDTWITTKARTAMLAQPGLQSTNLKIVTENNIIYLMGVVSRTQANLAAKVASRVSGVVKVVKIFEYEE